MTFAPILNSSYLPPLEVTQDDWLDWGFSWVDSVTAAKYPKHNENNQLIITD